MRTLLEFLPKIRTLGNREALRYHNGYRTWRLSYRELYGRIAAAVAYLDAQGLSKGDRLLIWSENRPAWVHVFWASIARGVEVVPVDFRSSARLVARIQKETQARLLVLGEEVDASGIEIPRISSTEVEDLPVGGRLVPSAVAPSDVVEIVYTSGTTGEPKGVVHRHKNICANLTPIQNEIDRFKWLAWPFQPVRLLDMLPLSHMFGQTTGLYMPPLLGGAAVFTRVLSPGGVIETIRRERASVLVSVPGLLKNLENEIERRCVLPPEADVRGGVLGIVQRWWRYRGVHRLLGYKFWALVVGGAELDKRLEAFWSRVGLLVVQGYGLTETSPVVAINHPFHTQRGSIGKPVKGQEVKIASNGEILVRGDSVVSEYVGAGADSGVKVVDGWLHTGDVGEIDGQGRLYYKGRLKEVIVGPDGLNVYPQDIEFYLNRFSQISESVVVPLRDDVGEKVHAVLVLDDPSADPELLVREANTKLEPHQRVRSWSIWPQDEFPRTPSTMKIKRGEVARRVAAEEDPERGREASAEATGVKGALARVTGKTPQQLGADVRLSEDLGLSSLERVELLAQVEQQYGIQLDEEEFAKISTTAELESSVRVAQRRRSGPAAGDQTTPQQEVRAQLLPGEADRFWAQLAVRLLALARPMGIPRWTRLGPIRWFRRWALDCIALPAFREMVRLKVEGIENLGDVTPPVIFAANHNSHFDTLAVYAALPRRWRHRLAPAMSQDFFRAYFEQAGFPWRQVLKNAGQYYLSCGLFNAYPLPQRMAGARRALKYTGELVDSGCCPLVFPEGERSPSGRMQSFKTGIGMMALKLSVPVVPVYLEGLYEVYSVHHDWPEPNRVRVRIGKPLRFSHERDYEMVARSVENAIRSMIPDSSVSQRPATSPS